MSLPLKPLPIAENWDCRGCGECCRGVIVELSAEDIRKLREQHWEDDPEMRGKAYLVRQGLFGKSYRLGHRRDGRCAFQMDNNLCRIHAKFGYDAKPHVCRMAPLQMVALDGFTYVTLRRYCPAAAADQGRPIAEQLEAYRELVDISGALTESAVPPPITRRDRRPWTDVLAVAETFSRLILDPAYPLVRRVVHGLQLCDLLDRASLRRLDSDRLNELLMLLAAAAVRESSKWFEQRTTPPQRATAALFRQTAFEYLRLHPAFTAESSWAERWELFHAAIAFSRARGPVPRFRLPFPQATFADLERPLGPISDDVLQPLVHFVERAVVSLRYAVLKPRWPLIYGFRSLALGLPVALWMLRWACGPRPPTIDDVIGVVRMLDRGESRGSLLGARHRARVRSLARQLQLAPLVSWYSR